MAESERFDAQGNSNKDGFSPTGPSTTQGRSNPSARNDARGGSRNTRSGGSAGGAGISQGIAAIRNVREVSRQHAAARAQLRSLKESIAEDRAVYDHRRQVESSYDRIVADETAEIQACRATAEAASERIATLTEERNALQQQLTELKAANEERLRPYRSLVDATKGRSDDAAVALADARRAVKQAETNVNDATRRREQRIAQANRAVDNAQERLRRVQGELDKLQSDPNASISALPRMRDEVTTEHARLDAARADVEKVTEEAQQAVDNAQTHLWTQKKSLELAERQAEETKREATERREEYDGLYKEAQAEESQLENAIKERTRSISDAERERAAAQERAEDAQAVLDEANNIHDNPQATAELAARISASQEEFRRRNEEMKELARTEKLLRKQTRGDRIKVFAIAGGVVIVLLVIIWLVFLRGCGADTSSATSATSTTSVTTMSTTETSSTSSAGTGTTSTTSTGTGTTNTGTGSTGATTGASGATGTTTTGTTGATDGAEATGATGQTGGSMSTTTTEDDAGASVGTTAIGVATGVTNTLN